MWKKIFTIALIAVASQVLRPGPMAQEGLCRLLDPEAARRYLPDRVPMETEVIALDLKSAVAIEFPDKSRIGFALLVNSGLSEEMKRKYQYVLVAETKIRLERASLPAGMVGLALEPETAPNAAIRGLIARDFSGTEIDRIPIKLDSSAQEASGVAVAPKGPKEFELRIGKYVAQGAQR